MNKLSVVVITFNEEIDLPKCLSTVKKIADEIIVVDSGSADNTLQIAKNFGAKTYFRKFDNYSNQKNYAMSKANGDWILSIDADEELEPELAKEILEKLRSNNSKFTAYSIPRKNIIFGKEINYNKEKDEIEIDPSFYFDINGKKGIKHTLYLEIFQRWRIYDKC